MTQEEIFATKHAIEVLRDALKRCSEQFKYGIPIEASKPIWNAANYLWRSLPDDEKSSIFRS